MTSPHPKILPLPALLATLDETIGTVVVTNGCFDLLHPGHVMALQDAARQGDILVVLLNSDRSVSSLKPGRPLYDQGTRAHMLAALQCVTYVTVFDAPDCAAEIRAIDPSVYAKGAEYKGRQDPAEARALIESAARIHWQPRIGFWSTSSLIAACARAYLQEEEL